MRTFIEGWNYLDHTIITKQLLTARFLAKAFDKMPEFCLVCLLDYL